MNKTTETLTIERHPGSIICPACKRELDDICAIGAKYRTKLARDLSEAGILGNLIIEVKKEPGSMCTCKALNETPLRAASMIR